jgi:hypothetical protein
MRVVNISSLTTSICAALVLAMLAVPAERVAAAADRDRPFDSLAGWWIGQGRLGFKEGKTEAVKCRATYKLTDANGRKLHQTVRCASASGKVEIESSILSDGKSLSGTWSEQTYNISGELSGQLVPAGFRVAVAGDQISAEMTIAVREQRHIVEIRFVDSTLLGLTMMFSRGQD